MRTFEFSPLFRRVRAVLYAGLLLVLQCVPGTSFASVIYEFRDTGSGAVVGTIEVQSPPASANAAWGSGDSTDLIGLFLDDSLFGLGAGNLLSLGGTLSFAANSATGTTLDAGSLSINFPTLLPAGPNDPTVDRSLSVIFDSGLGGDFIGFATTTTLPTGGVMIGDLFLMGDWSLRAEVPEPGSLVLLGLGLLAMAQGRRRTAR